MTHHLRPGLSLLLALTLISGCARKPDSPLKSREFTELSSDQQMKEAGDDFLSARDFQLYKHVREIPESCRYAFAGHDTDNQLYMSDPEQEYQGSQEKPAAKSPRQRLIYAGSNARTCYIYYEQQGPDGVRFHLTLFHLGPPVTLTYHGIDSKQIYPDLEHLRVAVNYRQFMRMTGSERFESERPKPKSKAKSPSRGSRARLHSDDPFRR